MPAREPGNPHVFVGVVAQELQALDGRIPETGRLESAGSAPTGRPPRMIFPDACRRSRLPLNLVERLKRETRSLHVEVERTPFIAALLRGRVDRRGYLLLLRNLEAIYAALEPALRRHAAHPALSRFDFEALARTSALAADIEARGGGPVDGDTPPPREQATVDYAARLAHLDQAGPERLLAHAYVRYLGDLSGGQVLGRIVRESLQLPPASGTAFYDFGAEPNAAALAARFRAALDRSRVADADGVVAEAKAAFERHRELFDALARRAGLRAAGRRIPRDAEPAMRRTAES
jgi:heme oxygenase